ncbi:hypothetical protein KBC79_03980 [Candidatus Woesebacteria bacterium]|nr:hypothetical protein [Candidatus Woesebacteria bacterium]
MSQVVIKYPCDNCKGEIDPEHVFCPLCGSKQPPVNDKEHFGLFAREKGSKEPFDIVCGGHILTGWDIHGLSLKFMSSSEKRQVYIGSYMPNEVVTNADLYTCTYKMRKWQIANALKDNLVDTGPREVTVYRFY